MEAIETVTKKRGRPRKLDSHPRTFVSFQIGPDQLQQLNEVAEQIGIGRSELIRKALKSYMDTAKEIAHAVARERERCLKYWQKFLKK